ncbi:MAG TPA: DUF1697 domain-containing protein [Thermoanaerobaculia bacterium]
MAGSTFIALLRGINVGGRNRVPMPELREICGELGWGGVATYVNSGNVVFTAGATAAALESALERAIEAQFGLSIPVIVRTSREWSTYLRSNPFAAASEREGNAVMLALSKAKPGRDAAKVLEERATFGERIARTGDAIWIHFARGVGKSKLSPGLIDRVIGSPTTMRNWRTVVALGEMVRR